MLGLIFRKAQNKIQDPAKLRQLIVELIGKENWSAMSADVKGDAYEGLLERNAQDVKSGAGQYFTPRPLIDAIVDCVQPAARARSIADPACGTGGFLLAAHDYLAAPLRARPGPEEAPALRGAARRRAGATASPPVRDEPATCTASAPTTTSASRRSAPTTPCATSRRRTSTSC